MCLCKDCYCLLVVDFQTVGPVFLTQYTLLHLGSFTEKMTLSFLVLQHDSMHSW